MQYLQWKINAVYIVTASIVSSMLLGCSSRESEFGIGVTNLTDKMVDDITVKFASGSIRIGALDPGLGVAHYGGILGPIPDAVEVSWTSQDGVRHAYPVKVKPLPPPTNTSISAGERLIFFIIQPDNTVKFMNHDPRFLE